MKHKNVKKHKKMTMEIGMYLCPRDGEKDKCDTER